MFGNTYSFIAGTLSRFGVEPRLCDLTDIGAVEKAVDSNTCCIYMEIITNPQMEVADLQALSRIVHERGIPLIVDTTLIPFTEFDSHSLGVDIEVVSSTKYLSGGATSIGGLVIDYGTCPGFGKRMRTEMLLNLGAYMTPHVAYMHTIGLETLDARYRIQSANAAMLAGKLRILSAVKRVNYVGLKDNPYYALAQRQFGPTAGAMITIDLESKEACFAFINRLKLIRRATNLFDNKTLAIHPASTILDRLLINSDRTWMCWIRLSVSQLVWRMWMICLTMSDRLWIIKRIRSKNPKVIYETVNIPQIWYIKCHSYGIYQFVYI